jgi:hypothetical protein
MTLSDIEHYATMVSGCESINQRDYSHPDAIYASAVLQLHVNDMGSYAGQEGFLDQVKKGASSVKEWIIKLVKAIKQFIFGKKDKPKKSLPKKEEKELVSKIESQLAEIKGGMENVVSKAEYFKRMENNLWFNKNLNISLDFDKIIETANKVTSLANSKITSNIGESIQDELAKIFGLVKKQASSLADGLEKKVKASTDKEEEKYFNLVAPIAKKLTSFVITAEILYDNFTI